jgi:hypothetical protein
LHGTLEYEAYPKMTDFHLVAALLGIGLALAILFLVRRDHLHIREGLFWIGVALVSLSLGIWPGMVDTLGATVGVAYPPAFLFLLAILVLLLRALLTDIAMTRLKRDLRRLNQRVALGELDDPGERGNGP